MEKGKASKTVYPDGTVGVFFRIDEKVYDKFAKKFELNGLKKGFKVSDLMKKFNK